MSQYASAEAVWAPATGRTQKSARAIVARGAFMGGGERRAVRVCPKTIAGASTLRRSPSGTVSPRRRYEYVL
jgi:hypothetical protein